MTATRGIAAFLILALFGGFGIYLHSHERSPDRAPDFNLIPYGAAGYVGLENRFDDFAYDVLKADTTTLRMYRDDSGRVLWLFVAYFASQTYGSQIHSPRHCLPGGGFQIESTEPFALPLSDGAILNVNRLAIANPRRRELMLYWYETRSGVITGEYGLKLDLMKNAVLLRPTDAAICRLTMPLSLTDDFDRATAETVRFIRQIYPAVRQALPFGNDSP